MGLLEGKQAIVIGATERGNIGQAIARRYRAEGAQVLIAGRRADVAADFAQQIGGLSAACDLTDRASVFALFDTARAMMGRVDIAVNSTGIAVGGPFVEFAEADLDRLIALQFKGSFFFLQAAVGAMSETGGAIIQMSSAVAQPGSTIDLGYEAYMGTKAGIDQVVRAVANQFSRHNLRINSISAGHTDTPMTAVGADGAPIPDWMKQAFIEQYPLGRYGNCEDIAEAAVWLARDQCFMTGQAVQVNGGLTLRRNVMRQDFERHEREWRAANAKG